MALTRPQGESVDHTATLPLSGLTIIEIAAFVAGPLSGMSLAQLGADVIRIDPIGGAADRDRWPVTAEGASLYWAGLNKNKRSLCLDLRSADGREILADLLDSSGPGGGIVITNAPIADVESLRARRPDLIFVRILGYPDGAAAVDYTINAGMGFPLATGSPTSSEPVNHVLPAWDIACGLYASLAILAAERQRRLDGRGQSITVSLQDVALSLAGTLGFLGEAEINGVDRPRIGNHLYGSFARDFATADGERVMVVALTRRQWKDLVQVTSTSAAVSALEAALGKDFSIESDRYEYRDALAGLIGTWFAARPYDELAAALSPTSVLWSRYRTFTEVLAEDVSGNPMMSTIDQPGIGEITTPGSPIRLAVNADTRPAPLIGQHTDDILRTELGLDDDEVRRLHDSGVVGGLR